MQTINFEFKLQTGWRLLQFRNGERVTPRVTNPRKVEGHGKPVDSGSTGYSWDAMKGRAYGSNAGVCLYCKHVPCSVGEVLLKKKKGKKLGWRKEHLNRAKCMATRCAHTRRQVNRDAPWECFTLASSSFPSSLLLLIYLHGYFTHTVGQRIVCVLCRETLTARTRQSMTLYDKACSKINQIRVSFRSASHSYNSESNTSTSKSALRAL